MVAWHPEDEDVIRWLQVVTDKSKQPIFVHCQHGADRTGTMVAIYRIIVEGWSKEEAIKELTEGGFGFHSIWDELVDYIQKLDVDEIAKKAGIQRK
jgi:protein tyrosine/serine phosphatase